jgi:hypothetical protein
MGSYRNEIVPIGGYKLSVKEAGKILTPRLVLPPKAMGSVFGMKNLPDPPINYNPLTLEQCARITKRRRGVWVLVYCLNLSVREIRKLKPELFQPSTFWDDSRSRTWLDRRIEPGYRLINLRAVMVGARHIVYPTYGFGYARFSARAYASTVLQAMIAVHALTRTNHRVLKTTFHVCIESRDEIAMIGGFEKAGILFYTLPAALRPFGVPDAGVVMCRMSGT